MVVQIISCFVRPKYFCYFLLVCLPVNYSVTVQEVYSGQYLPHHIFDSLRGQTRWRTPLYVLIEILVNMFKHQEQVHLPTIYPLTVTNVQESEIILDQIFFIVSLVPADKISSLMTG